MHQTRLAHAEPIPADDIREAMRLEALDRLDIIDTPADPVFDAITRLIRMTLDVDIGLVSLIDGHRQWYKSCIGLANSEMPRQDTFCRYTIEQSEPLIVPDTLLDSRFATHAFVTGDPHVRFYAGVPLRTADGHNVGTLCAIDFRPRDADPHQIAILNDLAGIAMAQMELRQMATTDGLTGLLSRHAFVEAATRATAVAQRQRYELSCIAFDIDHFKAVNDTHGHPAGDAVLSGVAAAAASMLRETDIVGRVGGEEFMAVVHAGRKGAADIAERMRHAIEARIFPGAATGVRLTASFGIATLDRDMAGFDVLSANADSALYEAKRDGRNRCVAWRGNVADAIPRRKVFKAGQIVFFNRMSTIDCTVRSFGAEGAGLEVSSTVGIPHEFTLIMRGDGFEARCRIVSRSERHIDVEFC
jgi:diguanylate cyclase (GGDEF)-like protein